MGRYRRTVSFQNPTPNLNQNPNPNLNISKHVRSVSLPCGRAQPLITHLHRHLTELRSWAGASGSGSARVVDGLTRLNNILTTYDDILQLSETQESLSLTFNKNDVVETVERLLEYFLRFVDVYEMFRSTMLGFKQDILSAQVAVRLMDRESLSHYITVHKKTGGEINKLISTVRSISIDGGDLHDEVAYVIRIVTVSVLGSIGLGHTRKRNWVGFGFGIRKDEAQAQAQEEEKEFVKVLEGVERLMELSKKRKRNNNNEKEELKKEVIKKMEEMEKCVEEMEKEGERVFRSLIITRVSLLNILTHAN